MTTKADIQEFIGQKRLAVVGVSSSGKKFSNIAYKSLKAKGYRVYAVNPKVSNIGGDACYDSIASIPEPVDGVVVVVPPKEAIKVVKDVLAAGVKRVWLQQGAESQEAIDFCRKNGVKVISRQCVLMFAEPTGLHKFHRNIWNLLGKLPE